MHIMGQSPSELLIGVSGIRGRVGAGLTPEVAVRFARAFGCSVQGQPVVVGRDSRPSGVALEHAVLAGLLSAGCPVLRAGVIPTPTLGVLVRQRQAGGGVQITASHNPLPDNGLKFFHAQGRVLQADEGQHLRRLAEAEAGAWDYQRRAEVADIAEPFTAHLERILPLVAVARIRDRRFRVLVDANGGAGGPAALELLERLTWPHLLSAVGCEPDGCFAHPPEPLAEHVQDIGPLVQEHGCDIGFILDPDADRLALLDETGRYVGEELTLALAALCRLPQQPGPVVVNLSTSRVMEEVARQHGCPVYRTPVGEAHVVETMQQVGAVLGGEGNGGVIDPRVGWVRDPFVAMALILDLLASTGKPVSALAGSLPAYAMCKAKRPLEPQHLPRYYAVLQACWPEARPDTRDGLRLEWPDRWVHVRPSNTEPVVRVIAEAPTAAQAQALAAQALLPDPSFAWTGPEAANSGAVP
jgi:phosphomannomutase